jgi:hypothetical protein
VQRVVVRPEQRGACERLRLEPIGDFGEAPADLAELDERPAGQRQRPLQLLRDPARPADHLQLLEVSSMSFGSRRARCVIISKTSAKASVCGCSSARAWRDRLVRRDQPAVRITEQGERSRQKCQRQWASGAEKQRLYRASRGLGLSGGPGYNWDMPEVHIGSDTGPASAANVRRLAVEVWRRAEAMGLVDEPAESPRRLDAASVARLIRRVRSVGIARGPALRLDNVATPSANELSELLRLVVAALEASPIAKYEWPAVARVFDPERLALLLGISLSSLRRYLSGARETPDDVAARLHHLALVVGDLAGAYNDVGIRRWFDRKRSALAGRSPAALLTGEWQPEDKGPQQVRALARSLTALSAT